MKDLILKIEDMLLDFRSTNQKATQDNNYQFQRGTTKLINVYPVSKTKDMYKRYQEKLHEYYTTIHGSEKIIHGIPIWIQLYSKILKFIFAFG